MKKSYFGVLTLSALMMASCSQDSVYVGEDPDAGGQVIDNVEMSTMPIQFSSPMPKTKGTGTVDNVDGTVNWGERTVRVYAVEKGTMPEDLTDRQKAPLLGGVDIRPADATPEGVITVKDTKQTYYYPRKGAFDFYGFYSDDAAGEDLSTAVKYDAGKQSYYVPFTIDGTQDLMMAKAAPNKELAEGYNEALLFSAQSARDEYRPKLTLEHQLARLSFYVVWGNENIPGSNASDEVFVQSLTVKGLKTQGQMHFMAVDDANRTLVWTDGTSDLPIKELDADGNSQDLNAGLDETVDVNDYATKAEFEAALEGEGLTIEQVLGKYHPTDRDAEKGQLVGTPIMVEPKAGTDGYAFDLVLVQYYDPEGNLIPTDQRETPYKSLPVKLGDGKNFEPGYNYDIKIKVNSLENIQVEVDIKPWENGDPVDIDPDDINPDL